MTKRLQCGSDGRREGTSYFLPSTKLAPKILGTVLCESSWTDFIRQMTVPPIKHACHTVLYLMIIYDITNLVRFYYFVKISKAFHGLLHSFGLSNMD